MFLKIIAADVRAHMSIGPIYEEFQEFRYVYNIWEFRQWRTWVERVRFEKACKIDGIRNEGRGPLEVRRLILWHPSGRPHLTRNNSMRGRKGGWVGGWAGSVFPMHLFGAEAEGSRIFYRGSYALSDTFSISIQYRRVWLGYRWLRVSTSPQPRIHYYINLYWTVSEGRAFWFWLVCVCIMYVHRLASSNASSTIHTSCASVGGCVLCNTIGHTWIFKLYETKRSLTPS